MLALCGIIFGCGPFSVGCLALLFITKTEARTRRLDRYCIKNSGGVSRGCSVCCFFRVVAPE